MEGAGREKLGEKGEEAEETRIRKRSAQDLFMYVLTFQDFGKKIVPLANSCQMNMLCGKRALFAIVEKSNTAALV